MHPAGSIIYFTVASGFGFGFLFFLGVGVPDIQGQTAFWHYFVAYGLAVTGLLSSLLHLGNPQRAWKALSQWRTSWLSREGVAAVATLAVLAPRALAQIFQGPDLIWFGYVGAILSIVTVICTAMIYGQLKTVPRWNQPLTPLLFLSYAFAGGAVLARVETVLLIAFGLVWLLQLSHWFYGYHCWKRRESTTETATGLGSMDGKVRLLEQPHTGKNYLTTEMVHSVGRKHAHKVRLLFHAFFLVAFLQIFWLDRFGGYGVFLSLAVATFLSRWLFFAEAEHVVSLYYDRPENP